MTEWGPQEVADRFSEAARTAHRLPPVRVQGYFNSWPTIQRMPWENLGTEPCTIRFAPDPAAVDRMLQAMQWILWLEVEQRHLVWMRAERYRWKEICHRLGCDRTTAWRRWQAALLLVASRLNSNRPAACGVYAHPAEGRQPKLRAPANV